MNAIFPCQFYIGNKVIFAVPGQNPVCRGVSNHNGGPTVWVETEKVYQSDSGSSEVMLRCIGNNEPFDPTGLVYIGTIYNQHAPFHIYQVDTP